MGALSYDVHCMILDSIKEDPPYFGEAKLSTIFRYALVCKALAKQALISLYQLVTYPFGIFGLADIL